uniref:HAUS augmin-like complex subunit 6 N-terminal domain-containing protein n=1 Tax=Anopheles christyi TaxID=43041 RepID=A0A182JVW1_9DIPT
MTVVNETNTKGMSACDVIKVIKTTRKSNRFSRKRLSVRAAAGKTRVRFTMSKKPTVKRTNSQLTVGPNVSAGGASVSRCEEQLDAAIYRCLTVLTKRHQPTDEFRVQFCRGAFLKPNTKAFIQVMHFLFNVYDAREFRKRFYWPIYDKGAENAFRTSTVEYVNSLIERGKLVGMEKIKAHVVVLPGGAKFMKFLLTLIKFVLQEELRRAKASSGIAATTSDIDPITKTRITQMIASHKRWVTVGERIGGIIREDVGVLTEKTRTIESLIEAALQGCELAKQMNYDKLMLLWDVRINEQYKEHLKVRQRMQTIAQEYDRVVEKTESKLKSNELTLPFTKDQLKDCLDKYICQPGMEVMHQHAQDVFDGNGKLNAIKLLQLFENVLPSVEQFFAGFCVKNPDLMRYEHKELSKVAIKFHEMRQEIDMLQRSLPPLDDCLLRDLPARDESPDKLGKDNFALKNKLFCTPPIVMDFDAQSDEFHTAGLGGPNGRSSHRLALLNREDVHAMNARIKLLSVSSYQSRSPKPSQKYRKPSISESSNHQQPASLTAAFAVPRAARKEKLNPLTMLNRIKAQSQKQGISSRSNSGAPPVNSTMNISTLSEMTLRPEFSSTLLGTPEKCGPGSVGRTPNEEEVEIKPRSAQTLQVPQQQLPQQVKRMVSSPNVHSSPRLMAIYAGSNTPKSTISPKTLLRGSGGQRTSLKRSSLIENESTVHTSPSGRLESLVKHDELPPRCHPLPLALEQEAESGTTSCQDSGDTSDEKTLRPENGGQAEDLSRTLLAISGGVSQMEIAGAECKPVSSGAETDELLPFPEPEEDDLFNVSAGIVTDLE